MVSSFTVVNHTNSNEGNKEKFMILKKLFKTFVLAVAGEDAMMRIAAPMIGGNFYVLHSGTGRLPGDL